MTKIVFKTPCFQDKNYQQELGAILPAWRWARIACHGNIKTVTNVFIQSETEKEWDSYEFMGKRLFLAWDFLMGGFSGNFLRNLGGGCCAGWMGRIASW